MSLHKNLERIRRMHALIKFRRTGTPEKFAERLGISVSLLYRLIGQLKEMGAPIHFCHQRQSYAYYESVELQIGFVRINNPRPVGIARRMTQAISRELNTDQLAAS